MTCSGRPDFETSRVEQSTTTWLLEAVHDISDQPVAVENVDELTHGYSGAPPTQTVWGVGAIDIGDWGPRFLRAGAPLVPVTAFEPFDQLLEWVLVESAETPEFARKIAALKGWVDLPALVDAGPRLQERLIALCVELRPLTSRSRCAA